MRGLCAILGWAALAAAAAPAADLAAALAEPNLEKRSRKALQNAERAFNNARQSYEQGRLKPTLAALEELRESVELAYESLKQTGKDPARSPKHFKHAEIKTRQLLRQLGDFRSRMAVDDREPVDPVYRRVETIHEDLLLGIMGKKKRGAK